MPFELYFVHETVARFVKIIHLNNGGQGSNNETNNK